VASAAASAGIAVRVDAVASLFQVRLGDHTAASAVATGTGAADLFVGLLLEGFYLAPRGMGAIATPATDTDVDDLAEAIIRVATRIAEIAEA
jgi:glutamate-1-semialdehyde aminotransferase